MNGNELNVGDSINVQLKIIDIVKNGDTQSIVGLTLVPHGKDGLLYSMPTVNGSQVTKV